VVLKYRCGSEDPSHQYIHV
jgi:hypothetical protein